MADRGRTTTYTEELAEEIIDRLESGEPLASICRDEHMPAVRTVSDWKKAHEQFAADFARAREIGFDAIAAEILHIADTLDEGNETTVDDQGRTTTRTADMLGHRKLRIETRMKLLAKWDPRRYGDKLDLTSDGEKLQPATTQVTIVPPKDDD